MRRPWAKHMAAQDPENITAALLKGPGKVVSMRTRLAATVICEFYLLASVASHAHERITAPTSTWYGRSFTLAGNDACFGSISGWREARCAA